MPKALWLDCDPGHDDSLAIILAGYSPDVLLLGISTVAANQAVEKVTLNALQILDAAGLSQIGVVQGQSKPLVRPRMECPEIHGESGLALRNGSLPPTNLQPIPGKAVLVMYERMWTHRQQSGQRVHLVCTGALTNAALLLTLFPEAADEIEQIVLMGGAIGSGNTNPSAEFNIQVDPEAAKIVFESGLNIVMVPLEVTHTALVTIEVMASIMNRRPTPFLLLIREILSYFSDTYLEVFGFRDPPLHDPCAVFAVIQPEAFKVEKMRVDIETVSPLTAGQTVVDIYRQSPLPANVFVAKEMDVKAFWAVQIAAIHAADAYSPIN